MADPAPAAYFSQSLATPLILAASILSILWGVVNAVLIRCINMNDPKPIEDALRAAEIEVSDAMPSNDDELETDEDLVKKSPNLILARMKWIGNQITDGAISFLN